MRSPPSGLGRSALPRYRRAEVGFLPPHVIRAQYLLAAEVHQSGDPIFVLLHSPILKQLLKQGQWLQGVAKLFRPDELRMNVFQQRDGLRCFA